jgi:endo-1,4-beta-xylanase
MTAAGRRVFDMLENQWMTDEEHPIPQRGEPFTVRGFHGEYQVKVNYLGQELSNLTQTFTLKKGQDKYINIHVTV